MLKNFFYYFNFVLFALLLSAECSVQNEINDYDPTNCTISYYYNSTNSTCDQCSTVLDYCMQCSNGTVCEMCQSPLFNITNGKCVPNCSNGTFLNPNTSSSQICQSCPSGCKSCDNSSSCNECYSPYSWNETQQSCTLSGGCFSGQFYNSTLGRCDSCQNYLEFCNICLNGSYCTSCYQGQSLVLKNGSCQCIAGTYKQSSSLPMSETCLNCSANCISCENLTSCTECESSFTWNETSKLCQKNIIDLTTNSTSSNSGDYWDLNLNITGIPQVYQLKLAQENIPGAFYWSKKDIYPNVYVSTNCSSSCAGFDLGSPPSLTNSCVSTPQNNESIWSLVTDESLTEPWCYLQFFVSANYTLNQSYSFNYYPEVSLRSGYNTFSYSGNTSSFRYFTTNFSSNFQGIEHATYEIIIRNYQNNSIEEIYIGSSDASANCNYIFPSVSHHCTGLLETTSSGIISYTFSTTNLNSTFYFAISSANYVQFYLEKSFTCDSGYYQPSVYQDECLPIINESQSWNLTGLATQWQNSSSQFWSFPLNYTQNFNNIYTLELQSTETLGTFYLFFNEEQNFQSIYISTNCTEEMCPSENYTSTPSWDQYCMNGLLQDRTVWSLSTHKGIGKCNFYFTIPAANSTPPVQFAYYPQLPLEVSQNYTNIPIPWARKSLQFFTYSIPSSIGNETYMVTISKLNIAVIQDLYFTSNDTYYQSFSCYSTFPTQSSTFSHCNVTQIDYSEGNMDYYKFVFQLSAGSEAVLGFVTNQNGTHNTFDFSSNYSIYHACDNGFFYNVTSLQCVNCSSYLDYCLSCENSQMCTQCLNNQLYVIEGKCAAQCPQGYYQNPHITSSSEVCFQCINHCISCSNNSTCNYCNPQFLWNATSQSCQPKITSCPSGQFYNANNASCINCNRTLWGCQICSSNQTCTQCNSQLTLNSFGQCLCPDGQYSNPEFYSSTLCFSCINHCQVCNDNSSCIQCFSPYTWNETSSSCYSSSTPSCLSGTFYNSTSGTCLRCSSVLTNCETCENSVNCTNCINNQLIIVNGQCTANCSSGSYKNPNITASSSVCLECMSNCISCTNNSTCDHCNTSYTWNTTSLSCSPSTPVCASGTFYNSTSGTCIQCSSVLTNCETCENSLNCTNCINNQLIIVNGQCTANCSSGSYKNPNITASSSVCLECMSNCISCTNNSTCDHCNTSYTWNTTSLSCSPSTPVCASGTFYNSTSGTCIQCSSVLTNCETCENSLNCTKCINTQLIIVNGQCTANCSSGSYKNPNITASSSVCLECMSNCISCTNNSTCDHCNTSYTWNTTSLSCSPSTPVCASGTFYNSTSGTCIQCSSVLTNCETCENSLNCTNCINNQLIIVNGQCTANCSSGSYKNPNITASSSVCLQCMSNCISCTNNSTCDHCNTSYIWNATSLSCSPSTTPPVCASGTFYNSTSATCIQCSSVLTNCETCENSVNCTKCINTQLIIVNGQCTANCSSGSYKNPNITAASSVCLQCMSNCISCINNSTCDHCNTSYTWNKTSLSCSPSTPVCASGTFYNSTSGTCIQCSSVLTNCETCENSLNCTNCINNQLIIVNGQCTANCSSGQYKNPNITATSSVCLQCMNNCISCTNNSTCDHCNTSYTWNTTSLSCSPSTPVCASGTFYNSTSGTCIQCSSVLTNCETCENSLNCTNCINNQLIIVNGQCTANCSSGQYKNPNITATSSVCLQCMNNCISCTNNSTCDHCNTSYTWNTTSLSCSPSTPVCASGTFYNSTSATCIQCSSVLTNCETCENSLDCTKCINPQLIIVNGQCTANCSSGYYQNPNIISSSQVCLPCMSHCKSCTSNTTCNVCDLSYLWNSTTQTCQQIPTIYHWDLTGLPTSWQNEQEKYWSFELNYSSNMTNIYELKLTTNESIQQTPGTIYIFYNINAPLHNVYVSTNCSTVEACHNYTTEPSEENYCWVAGNSSVWSMNTKKSEGQCYFYFSIPELTETPKVQFAFFPQLTLSQAQNYTDLSVPWDFQTEQFFTYKFSETYLYKNAQNGVHKLTFSGMNSVIVSQMYVATDDSRYNSTCSSTFPDQLLNCGLTSSNYSADNTTYLAYTFSVDQATSHIVLGFLTNSQNSINYFDFNSNSTFSCNEHYILNNNTCEREQTQDLTNSSTIHSSGSSNKSYWNVSIDPSPSQGEEKVFNVQIEPINFPGTFYLSSELLSTVYISTNCNSSKPCNSFTETPQAEQYCFTQEAGQNGIFVNSYEQDSSESCKFDFVFPNAANANGLVQMQYFPIEEITDTSSYQIYIPSSASTLPRYIKYNLPAQTAIPENFDHFIIKISNIPYQLIDNIYYSTNDQINIQNGCVFTQFPDSNSDCSYINVSQSETILSIEFNVTSTSSEHYIALYTKQSNNELSLNLIVESSIECKQGYYYQKNSSQCEVQTVSCSEGQYYDHQKLECVECSANLPYCAQCSSTGSYCTKCLTGEYGQITLTEGSCLVSCISGKYPNPAKTLSELCLSCMEHCIQCTSATTCQECYEPTYKWKDSQCENVCKTGQYYDKTKEQCVSCEVQYCTVCYGSGKQCSQCTDGYEPVQSVSNEYACQKVEKKPKSSERVKFGVFTLILLIFLAITI